MPNSPLVVTNVLNTVLATHADIIVAAKTYVTQITFTGNSTIVNPVWLDPVAPYLYTANAAGTAQVSTETLAGSVVNQPYTLAIYKYPGLNTPNTVVAPQYETELYVCSGATDTALATAFTAKITANPQSYVTATSSAGVITLTAKDSTATFVVEMIGSSIGTFATTTANVPSFGVVNSQGTGISGLPNVYIAGLITTNTYVAYRLVFYAPVNFSASTEGVNTQKVIYYLLANSADANVGALTTQMNAIF